MVTSIKSHIPDQKPKGRRYHHAPSLSLWSHWSWGSGGSGRRPALSSSHSVCQAALPPGEVGVRVEIVVVGVIRIEF